MTAYERALRQRNRLLKDWEGHGVPPELEAWDAELVSAGSALTIARRDAVQRLAGRAQDEFAVLCGDAPELGTLLVEYRPSVEGEPAEEAFMARLAERRADEIVRRTTLVGPHRDDLGLHVQGIVARGFASHGEAWGAAISLRLALGATVAEEVGETPLMFLDDPFSPFDPERRRRVSDSLDGRGQVFVAVPDDAQIPRGSTVWRVKEGAVVRE